MILSDLHDSAWQLHDQGETGKKMLLIILLWLQ